MKDRIESHSPRRTVTGKLVAVNEDQVALRGYLMDTGTYHTLNIFTLDTDVSRQRVDWLSSYNGQEAVIQIVQLTPKEVGVSIYIFDSRGKVETGLGFTSEPKLLAKNQPEDS